MLHHIETTKTLHWQVVCRGTPTLRRTCPRCGGTEYASSRRFRVNANAKSLDVWLVFNCTGCKNSYNLTILTRVSPKSIPKDLLEGFHTNNAALADRYARDRGLLKQNGVAAPPLGEGFLIEGEDALPGQAYRIILSCPEETALRLDKALAHKTGLSRAAIARLCEEGRIQVPGQKNALRTKLRGEAIVLLDLRTPYTSV